MRRFSLAVFALGVALATSGLAFAANPHCIGTPTCDVVNDQVCCSGKIAGLASIPTIIQVTSVFTCTNQGQNVPPGQTTTGSSGPLTPGNNGQLTFANVCTQQASCPDQMTETFGPAVTISVFQGGSLQTSCESTL
jgi:hypothetical protein